MRCPCWTRDEIKRVSNANLDVYNDMADDVRCLVQIRADAEVWFQLSRLELVWGPMGELYP